MLISIKIDCSLLGTNAVQQLAVVIEEIITEEREL